MIGLDDLVEAVVTTLEETKVLHNTVSDGTELDPVCLCACAPTLADCDCSPAWQASTGYYSPRVF